MRVWTCKGCGERHPRTRQKCPCGHKRPTRKTAAQKALTEDYAKWVERFGESCGICGRGPSSRRRLDRDHCHHSLAPRGLLCHSCNRALPHFVTVEWLERAADYLRRFEAGEAT